MKGLLMRDFINYKSVYVVIAILIPFGYVTSLPPFQISLGLLLPVVFVGVFYSDHRARINRYMVSLPINRNSIVFARYISMLIVWIGTIIYQFIIGHIIARFAPYDVFTFGWKEILVLLCLGLIMLAIFVPLYYLFKSFYLPSVIFLICYFTVFIYSLDALVNQSGMENEIIFNYLDQWTVPLIESIITVQPFLVLPIVAFGVFYLSIVLSKIIICRKEI